MLYTKIFSVSLVVIALVFLGGCKTSTDAAANNNFSADISYDGAAAVHYVSDDFHIHFNRVSGNIDTLIITADKGEKADIFVRIFMEIDSIQTGTYPIRYDASITHQGVSLEHTGDDGTFFAPTNLTTDSFTITDLDIGKQAVKGTFHCTLYESGITGGKKAEITNGSFSWNY